jgi:hypothetical protein
MSRRASTSGPPKCVMTVAFMPRRRADCITWRWTVVGGMRSMADEETLEGQIREVSSRAQRGICFHFDRKVRGPRREGRMLFSFAFASFAVIPSWIRTVDKNKKTGAVLPRDLRRFPKTPEDIARMCKLVIVGPANWGLTTLSRRLHLPNPTRNRLHQVPPSSCPARARRSTAKREGLLACWITRGKDLTLGPSWAMVHRPNGSSREPD